MCSRHAAHLIAAYEESKRDGEEADGRLNDERPTSSASEREATPQRGLLASLAARLTR